DPDFSIAVKSNFKPKLGEDFIFRNITAPDKTPEASGLEEDSINIETVNVEASGSGEWTILSARGGFTPGHTYQIELLNDDVTYDDSGAVFGNMKENNPLYDIRKVRFFNFSIEKDGTLNLKLDKSIKYINAEELHSADRANLME